MTYCTVPAPRSPSPITPAEVGRFKLDIPPPEVIDVFNELIAAHWDGSSATVAQRHALDRIAIEMGVEFKSPDAGPKWTAEVLSKGWLNIEALYESAGWKVTYDKPGYNETYPATFTFSHPIAIRTIR